MAQQILPTIDFRTGAERQGITKNQQTAQSIAEIIKTIGRAEQNRQDRQDLERITKAISEAGTLDAISQAANASPVFSEGLRGGLQRFAGKFQPSPGGVGQGIQSSIINATLQQALTPKAPFTLGPEQERFSGTGQPIARGAPKAITPSQQIAQKQLDRINELEIKEREGTSTTEENTALAILRGEQKAPLVQIDMGKPASAAERTTIAEGRASIDALDNIKTLFDSARTKTGVITGRVSPIAGLVGLTTDEQESFMAATSAFKNAIIKEITGAQMSETEATRILKQVPDITDPPKRWQAKWEQSKKNLEFLQKRRIEILRQSGIRVPQGQPGSEEPTSQVPEQTEVLPEEQEISNRLAEIERELAGEPETKLATTKPTTETDQEKGEFLVDRFVPPKTEKDLDEVLRFMAKNAAIVNSGRLEQERKRFFNLYAKRLGIKKTFEEWQKTRK